jgi:hypothetical protein
MLRYHVFHRYAERRYAERRYDECRGALLTILATFSHFHLKLFSVKKNTFSLLMLMG